MTVPAETGSGLLDVVKVSMIILGHEWSLPAVARVEVGICR